VRDRSLAELRSVRADRNPDPQHFPEQDARVTPLARLFAERHGFHPYTLPTVADLFAFARAYAGPSGMRAGKTRAQRLGARRVRFDLEMKRVPYRSETIGDGFDGESPGLLERAVVKAVRAAGVVGRTTVRSFDHRSVRALRRLEPDLTAAVLVEGTAPVDLVAVARQANASVYCPDYQFVDAALVRQAHAVGVRIVPWTVNEPADWERLIEWGVDGLTTDFPDRLAAALRERGLEFAPSSD
jgi:glycerophosphoryl diester phosphodiesterase